MKIKEKVYIVATKDRKKIMKGLSKSIRFMEDPSNNDRYTSVFSTRDSAERWILSGRVETLYPYTKKDLEIVETEAVYKL